MEITDEIIACYVEGTATPEERRLVRDYLGRHPEEYERILCLMDNDTADFLEERNEAADECLMMDESSFSNIAYSAAAFAPEQSRRVQAKAKYDNPDQKLYGRLNDLWDELDKI